MRIHSPFGNPNSAISCVGEGGLYLQVFLWATEVPPPLRSVYFKLRIPKSLRARGLSEPEATFRIISGPGLGFFEETAPFILFPASARTGIISPHLLPFPTNRHPFSAFSLPPGLWKREKV